MKRNPEFIISEVCDDKLLIPVGKMAQDFSGIVKLNGTGAFIWELLAEETTADAILAAVSEKYRVPAERAREGVMSFLSTLQEAGCLKEDHE